MPKTNNTSRQTVLNTAYAPTSGASKKITVNGKTVIVTANTHVGKSAPRMKGKVEHKGAAAETKKLEAAIKTLKGQHIGGIDECEMIQKKDGQYKITNWKNPKIMCTSEGGVFFVTGANKVEEMTEEQFNKAAQAQIEEITKQFAAPAAEEKKEEEVKEEKKEEAETPAAEEKKE
ncbi:transcription factor BTF3, putative [Entamoeba histolytica HM-1:IMSS-B]|uniref:Transcription factor BTF3, putative n=6 Tax=Entamoeba histolytica TaxID=5759 RepID=C4LWT3_ENTH1|nr:transcription factor BTF3, putative [Entamoeba histolytica HM-1:IMSS]EMD42423.1 transcription factor BTF3, putative [Entamoeba histolytica KU27]EMH75678.1 transcription factor BTF3, putative [Entamoeba histolytica HM-1:IMSS-B]EMS11977.1 transcription factor BTF3, putative [Entamoeba histolytica HM-3:IMSS]ENY65672.1 transcription factor BTF3, putative [Entamoeba histolytica HM-1:IMSS-A]GAT93176.1 transcription factor btf3 putative [Entamoeba histolytica]|eukprot:XP_654992.1 transcription factor BTF3, putative [Entamoeba histolytica HM-1:IMSS]